MDYLTTLCPLSPHCLDISASLCTERSSTTITSTGISFFSCNHRAQLLMQVKVALKMQGLCPIQVLLRIHHKMQLRVYPKHNHSEIRANMSKFKFCALANADSSRYLLYLVSPWRQLFIWNDIYQTPEKATIYGWSLAAFALEITSWTSWIWKQLQLLAFRRKLLLVSEVVLNL